jgi:outer membrane protein OmpA-like peptidoglycan-associated protein
MLGVNVRNRAAMALALATIGTTACQSLKTNKEKGAVIGAAAGAATGAVVGKATGSTARGAIVGAAVGGAAGAIIGHQMDQKAKEIAQSVPGATVTRVGEGLVVTFESGLLFDFDSDKLRGAARENLNSLAANLSSFGDSRLLLVGHTDSVGTDAYNQSLSQRRAQAVAQYLIERGVERSRLAAAGRGEREPIASNGSDSGRQENRRVEVAVYASDKMKSDAKALAGKSGF